MIITITGTNTDVGKTISTAALAAALSAAGNDITVAKPIQTGAPVGERDIDVIEKLSGISGHQLAAFPEPLAPNLSARRAGMTPPDLGEVVAWIRKLDAPGRIVLVEGAGGLLVRLAESYTLADVAAALGSPVIVVTSTGLGSLNLAELTVREAQRSGLDVAALIGGSLPATIDLATQLNLAEFPKVTGVDLWGTIPAGAGEMDGERFREAAVGWLPAALAPVQLRGFL